MRTGADGLFFHPDGMTAADVLKRMAEGVTNYNLDDPFKPAIDETADELARVKAQIERAEYRLITLKHEQARLERRLEAQQAAVANFAATGEIDEVLYPSVDALAEAEAAAQREEIKAGETFVLPTELKSAGWEADKSIRVTDTEIIVTLRKRRTDTPVDVEKVQQRIEVAVREAIQPFATDVSPFRSLLRDRIAARPQQPREPPDD